MLSFVGNRLYERTSESLAAEQTNKKRIVLSPTGVETWDLQKRISVQII